MSDLEIEIQVVVENTEPLIKFLEKNGKFVSRNHQIDDYFVPAHRDFTKERPLREWLRLRNSNGSYSINYKNWHYDKNGQSLHYCDEFESGLNDAEATEKVFAALNLRKIITVDKTRRIWKYSDYEISIDLVVGLGDSVEIEYKGENASDKEKIVKEMIDLLKNLECGKIQVSNDGYPFRLLFPSETKFESI